MVHPVIRPFVVAVSAKRTGEVAEVVFTGCEAVTVTVTVDRAHEICVRQTSTNNNEQQREIRVGEVMGCAHESSRTSPSGLRAKSLKQP